MKIRNLLLALVALGLVFTPATTYPQAVTLNVDSVRQVGGQVTDDGDVAMVCKYIGTEEDGEIDVDASTGDITFTSGDNGSEAADTTLECPVSGALGGIIDVSNAACNTMVEVLDIINDADSDWRCVPIDALGTDDMGDTLLTLADTSAVGFGGLELKWDTTSAFELTHAFTDKTTIEPYCSGGAGCSDLRKERRPEVGLTTLVTTAHTVSTYGSGDSFFNCYSVDWYFSGADNEYTETITQVFTETNGSTTAAKLFDTELTGGIFSKPDERLICRIDNSAAASSATLTVQGLQYNH